MAGWQETSSLIVVGDNALIVVDPGENDNASSQIMKDFRETTGIHDFMFSKREIPRHSKRTKD